MFSFDIQQLWIKDIILHFLQIGVLVNLCKRLPDYAGACHLFVRLAHFFSESLTVNSQPLHVWTVDGTDKPAQARRLLAQGLIGAFHCSTGPKPRTFWGTKLRQATCWKLCNTIFRTLFIMLNLLYKDSVGVGLDASSNIHFVNVELFHTTNTTFTSTKDAGIKHCSADGSFQVSLKR